ncbi:unnamed protein product [Brugia pahangi]|uniref:DUF3265 domain-containing protein n=1 Tax=Brugia pahangi TaxID=6280 RepID=A0A0N4T977_BRUPA|nr:unnamed protein product [Brugia pahangi]
MTSCHLTGMINRCITYICVVLLVARQLLNP